MANLSHLRSRMRRGNDAHLNPSPMKLPAIVLLAACLTSPVSGSEDETKFKSPDGKFAMQLEKVEGQETR